MSPEPSLFRHEVLDSDAKRAHGDVLLVYPVSNYFMLGIALALLAALCVFAGAGQYTRHANVAGVLEPGDGMVKLYASQNGSLKHLHVREGQSVHKGQVLLVFEAEHAAANGQAIETELDEKLREQLTTLHHELGGTIKLHEVGVATMQRDLAALEQNRATLAGEIKTQNKRIQSARAIVAKFEKLQHAGFMPEMQTQQRLDDLMDQQMRLQTLQKQATSADAEIAKLRTDIENSPLREQVAKAQIDRNIASTESELSKHENGHEWSLVAPCDGVIASLSIGQHQSAGAGVPLITIIPSNSQLQAVLYAPSRALGFVQAGQTVKLKLDAFPYQKFGIAEGTVISIADSPARPSEIAPGTRLGASGDPNEPLYTIRVSMAKQSIAAYGKQQRLRPGMQLDAEIELETRRLYEWVFEPLYSMQHG